MGYRLSGCLSFADYSGELAAQLLQGREVFFLNIIMKAFNLTGYQEGDR